MLWILTTKNQLENYQTIILILVTQIKTEKAVYYSKPQQNFFLLDYILTSLNIVDAVNVKLNYKMLA